MHNACQTNIRVVTLHLYDNVSIGPFHIYYRHSHFWHALDTMPRKIGAEKQKAKKEQKKEKKNHHFFK